MIFKFFYPDFNWKIFLFFFPVLDMCVYIFLETITIKFLSLRDENLICFYFLLFFTSTSFLSSKLNFDTIWTFRFNFFKKSKINEFFYLMFYSFLSHYYLLHSIIPLRFIFPHYKTFLSNFSKDVLWVLNSM